MEMLRIRKLAVAGLALVLTACIPGVHVHKDDRRVRGFDDSRERFQQAAQHNATLLTAYQKEWQFNRNPQDLPQLCVAMSGGGMRSAAYNIGVLKGLHDLGELEKVDILSSVSGGGYALSWFYLQQYYSERLDTVVTPAELFDDNGPFQHQLGRDGNLVSNSADGLYEFAKGLVTWVGAFPLHISANGIFDWRLNLNPWRHFYESSIERVFHVVPPTGPNELKNTGMLLSPSVVDLDLKAEFPHLRKFILKRRLPYFIVNATAAIDDDGWRYNSELSKSVYEFTPLYHGSDAFGYRDDRFPVSISRAVSISGAAVDSNALPGARRQLAVSLANFDLGFHISNPESDTPWWTYPLPYPLYVFPHNVRDIHGPSIYLTDGGHSENLGAYSLIRRLCGHIVIVDAEHDPDVPLNSSKKKFEALKRLQHRVFAELGAELHLPDVARFDPACPVMSGTVGPFPLNNGGKEPERRNIKVTYIKLSMDTTNPAAYPESVRTYYEGHKLPKKNLFGVDDPFPHQPTFDLNLSRAQYLAYRDLGHYHAMQFYHQRDCDGQRMARPVAAVTPGP